MSFHHTFENEKKQGDAQRKHNGKACNITVFTASGIAEKIIREQRRFSRYAAEAEKKRQTKSCGIREERQRKKFMAIYIHSSTQ